MSECVFRDGKKISDFGRPYFIAEVNSSHGGSMDRAKAMIDSAVEIGCDCVKFQSWSAESLYSKSYYDTIPYSRRFVSKFALRPEQLEELSGYCRQKEIGFSSTPYSEEEVDFLVDRCNVPFIKIASMEIDNIPFLRYIGGKSVPLVLSTGMSTIDEVERAVSILEEAGASQMVLLHCVSIYPTIIEDVNLNNIIGLREHFSRYPIGFSDHTEGDSAAIASVALGAGLIEKHLTLDKSRAGMDNGMATEPDDFNRLVEKCLEIQVAMGSRERRVSEDELKQRRIMRRSVIAVKEIKRGDVISRDDLYTKRPGDGIRPGEIDKIVGKTAKRDIEADTVIYYDDIE